MLKEAGFRYPRIAWDWRYRDYPGIERQVSILKDAGYRPDDIYVFMLYNWDIPFEELEQKRLKCWEWRVQIADCRYRPLDQLYDHFDPKKEQTSADYYIHPEWSDRLIKQFRGNVRKQNICIRQKTMFYSKEFERKKFDREVMKRAREIKNRAELKAYLSGIGADFWFPDEI